MEEFGATRELRILKAEKRAFNINKKAYPGECWQLVCQVDCDYGTKTVTLRSVLQVITGCVGGWCVRSTVTTAPRR